MRPGKRRILIALGALVILGGLAAIFLPPYLRRSWVEKRLSAFDANPCQKTADALIDLLGEDDVTQEQGNEILKALLQPRVVVEDSNLTGQKIEIKVEPENPVDLRWLSGGYENYLYIEGITPAEGYPDSESLIIAPSISDDLIFFNRLSAVFPAIRIQKAGTYKGKVRMSYGLLNWDLFSFEEPSVLERILTKLRPSKPAANEGAMTFECSYEIPFQIRVVAPKPTDSNPSALPAR